MAGSSAAAGFPLETRFRCNPNIDGIVAMAPGAITSFYLTPVTRAGFLFGKELRCALLALANFFILPAVTVLGFGALAAGLCVPTVTAIRLGISSVLPSRIAAIFATVLPSMVPASLFSGPTDPVWALDGGARAICELLPATHVISIAGPLF